MKSKIIIPITIILFILTGCELNNNPTSKVEELLGKYQSKSKEITYNYTMLSKEQNLSENIIKDYNDLIKKQYQNLSYEIKEETTDGDFATITTEIEVLDYKNVLTKYESIDTTNENTQKEIIKELNDTKNKITYTIDFTCTKDDNGNWMIDELSTEQHQKLLGIY